MTRRHDPMVPWLMLLAFLGVVAVSLLVGFLLDNWITGLIIGIAAGRPCGHPDPVPPRRARRVRADRGPAGRLRCRTGHAQARLDHRGPAGRRQPPHAGRRLPRHRPSRRRACQRRPQQPGQAAGRRRTQAACTHPPQRHHPRDRERPRRGPGAAQPDRQEDEQAQGRTDQDRGQRRVQAHFLARRPPAHPEGHRPLQGPSRPADARPCRQHRHRITESPALQNRPGSRPRQAASRGVSITARRRPATSARGHGREDHGRQAPRNGKELRRHA